MSSPTRRNLQPAEVKALVASAFDTSVADCDPLSGGFFAAVWRATLDDGRQVVLKVGPPPETPVLTYEQGLSKPRPSTSASSARKLPECQCPRC